MYYPALLRDLISCQSFTSCPHPKVTPSVFSISIRHSVITFIYYFYYLILVACVCTSVCAHAFVHTCILCMARLWRSEVSLGELVISYFVEAMISLGSSSRTSLQRTLLSLPPILPWKCRDYRHHILLVVNSEDRIQVIGLAQQVPVCIEPHHQPFCNHVVLCALIFTIFSVLASVVPFRASPTTLPKTLSPLPSINLHPIPCVS